MTDSEKEPPGWWSRLRYWLGHSVPLRGLVFALLIVSLALSIAVPLLVMDKVKCIGAYADHKTDRDARVATVNAQNVTAAQEWIDALGVVLDDAITKNQAKLMKDLPHYQAIYERYKATTANLHNTLRDNPIPPPPKFSC